jgi:hypothetical protein
MKLAATSALILLGLGASSLALAQPGAPDSGGAPAPPPDPVPPGPPSGPPPSAMVPVQTTPPPPPGVDPGVVEDAASPGAFVFPTALSEPAGTVAVSASGGADTGFHEHELTSVSGSYAITNQISVSGTVFLPTEDFNLYMVSAKGQVLRANRLRVALQGNILFNSNDYAALLGGAATYCIDEGCNSYASGYLGVGLAHQGNSSIPFVVSGSIVFQIVPHLKVVGEAVTGFATGDVGGTADGFLGFYGARVTSKYGALNVGFAKPYGVNVNTDFPGVLFASVTGRFFAM